MENELKLIYEQEFDKKNELQYFFRQVELI